MTKRTRLSTLFVLLAFVSLFVSSRAMAAAEVVTSYTPEFRYVTVDGEVDKFQAHHWMQAGLDGGIRDFELKTEDAASGFSLWNEARFFPGNADYFYDLEMKKEDVGFAHLEFNQFRKYFDNSGGIYTPFTRLNGVSANRDLYLDMGKLEIEAGVTPPSAPDVIFVYEYEYKLGTKSRLTWSRMTEGSITRGIGPTWQEIDEEVHVFEVKVKDDWHGTEWSADQKWERAESKSTREERYLSTNTTASERKMRDQILEPKSDLFSSVWEAKRWLWKDKVHIGGGYRYGQIENREVENIFEMDESRNITNFTFSEQVVNAVATNQYRTHTGVMSAFWLITDALKLDAKVKYENIDRESFSIYPKDNGTQSPNRTIEGNDQVDYSNVTNDLRRWGEAISLRYSGIPRVVFYNDVEFEQVRNNLVEFRDSGSSSELFSRQTINNFYRGVETLGFNAYPCDKLRIAGQYRYRRDNVDFDDLFETGSTASGAKSGFVDDERTILNEGTLRATVNIFKWLNPTMRYQLKNYDYIFRFEGFGDDTGTQSISNVYTIDVPFQITPELSVMASYQFQDVRVVTPARFDTTVSYPTSDADVHVWMTHAAYQINKDLYFDATFQYQIAQNFDNFAPTSVPFGAEYDQYEIAAGFKYKVMKNVTLEPKYAFYFYEPNADAEFGKYEAHVAWLGVKIDWA